MSESKQLLAPQRSKSHMLPCESTSTALDDPMTRPWGIVTTSEIVRKGFGTGSLKVFC